MQLNNRLKRTWEGAAEGSTEVTDNQSDQAWGQSLDNQYCFNSEERRGISPKFWGTIRALVSFGHLGLFWTFSLL